MRTDSLVVFAINTKEIFLSLPNPYFHPQEAGYAATFVGLFNDVAANNLYMINMPRFIIDELHEPITGGEKNDFGIAAGLEIPMMLIAGYYMKLFWQATINAHCYREWNVFLRQRTHGDDSGGSCNCKFLMPSSLVFSAGIGMLYFQDLMPEK